MTLLADGLQWLSTWEGLFFPRVLYRGETTSHVNNHWCLSRPCRVYRQASARKLSLNHHICCAIQVFYFT